MNNRATNLPAVSDATLPQRYEAARNAIAECEQIDECKTWSDKAAALASYARQAKDDSLRVMAVRIQARAERRCGELLKQVEPATGAHLKRDGAVPALTRTQAATDAGLSERQRKTALRIATIPEEQFDYAVESQDPPTVTALAALGIRTQPESTEREASIDSVMAPDDKLAAAQAEVKRQAAEIERLTKQVERLEGENESLRERIAIMEAG